jgi:predicted MFS family arabinose efflux permease
MMRRFGRRAGFICGASAGVLGGLISATGIYLDSFSLFCAGSAVFGIASGFGQYYRFAAADIVEDSYKSRAISWVLVGGLVAAFIGPNTASITREMIPDAEFSASYIAIAVFCTAIVLLQIFMRVPKPSVEESQGEKRPLTIILSQPVFLVAVLCAMIAYGTMNLLMTATPLAMHDHGMNFGATAVVLQWHIVGMFAPSFFTGHLIHRFGVLRIMFIGALLMLACAMVALYGQLYIHFVVGLLMLGLGWNFLYTGSTTLLTEVYLPAEKANTQGINEFMVFSATAMTAMSSGYLHHTLGWERLNQSTIPIIVFSLSIIIFLGWSKKKTP